MKKRFVVQNRLYKLKDDRSHMYVMVPILLPQLRLKCQLNLSSLKL